MIQDLILFALVGLMVGAFAAAFWAAFVILIAVTSVLVLMSETIKYLVRSVYVR